MNLIRHSFAYFRDHVTTLLIVFHVIISPCWGSDLNDCNLHTCLDGWYRVDIITFCTLIRVTGVSSVQRDTADTCQVTCQEMSALLWPSVYHVTVVDSHVTSWQESVYVQIILQVTAVRHVWAGTTEILHLVVSYHQSIELRSIPCVISVLEIYTSTANRLSIFQLRGSHTWYLWHCISLLSPSIFPGISIRSQPIRWACLG